MAEGKIRFGGGKCELLRTGAYDGIDMAVGMHAGSMEGVQQNSIPSNGTVNKIVTVTVRSAHAGSGPHLGVDALAAANIAMLYGARQ